MRTLKILDTIVIYNVNLLHPTSHTFIRTFNTTYCQCSGPSTKLFSLIILKLKKAKPIYIHTTLKKILRNYKFLSSYDAYLLKIFFYLLFYTGTNFMFFTTRKNKIGWEILKTN